MQSELYHHGILGQRWGIRRYQNEDGTLTDAGRRRQRQFLDTAEKGMREVFGEEETFLRKKKRNTDS